MVVETFLSSPFVVRVVLPFLLIFTLIFAILQKSKILGEGKSQIDALIALSIALIVVVFSWSTDIIINLMPFLAVSLVVILCFLLIYGFVGVSDAKEGLKINDRIKWAIVALGAIGLVLALLVVTGQWDRIYRALFVDYGSNSILSNTVLLLLVIGAMAVVVFYGKDKGSHK